MAKKRPVPEILSRQDGPIVAAWVAYQKRKQDSLHLACSQIQPYYSQSSGEALKMSGMGRQERNGVNCVTADGKFQH